MRLMKGAAREMTGNLKIVDGAPPEPPAGTPLSPARRALADAIALRGGIEAEAVAIDVALRRLSSLVIAEKKAADAVSALEADAAAKALQWARTGADEAPSLPNGANLKKARELLAGAQAQAAAARAASYGKQAGDDELEKSARRVPARTKATAY